MTSANNISHTSHTDKLATAQENDFQSTAQPTAGSNEPALSVQDISKHYLIYDRPQDRLKQMLWRGKRNFYRSYPALQNVSFTLRRGETMGIVGHNGSGKSTLLQIICGTLNPSAGAMAVNGRISALLELGAGFNVEFTGHENIYFNGAILGLNREQIDACYEEIIAFANIGEFIHRPVKTYSSGMYVRLAFAIAVAVVPDILIVDEALAVGDEAFQRKCFSRIKALQEQGSSILFVSHSAATILEICDRALLLDAGELLLDATPRKVINCYHKLLFAPAELHDDIRQAIRNGTIDNLQQNKRSNSQESAKEAVETPVINPAKNPVSDSSYDEGLKPETMVVYPTQGGEISATMVLNEQGERCNILQQGERYYYQYRVKFTQTMYNVRFSMLIKNNKGMGLAGAVSNELQHAITQVNAGDEYLVRFPWQCQLRADSYFLNCGAIRDDSDGFHYIHRIVDANMVKVLPKANDISTGVVDLVATAECEMLS
jgi:lipopolysaccharide transport system ATP-binding protein